MKKYYGIVAAFFLGAVVCSGIVSLQYRSEPPASAQDQKPIKTIALMTPLLHPSLEAIKKGFIDTLHKSKNFQYQFTSFDANGNRILMLSQAEEVVKQGYDLIIPIATSCAQTVKEVTLRRGSQKPLVFISAEIGPLESSNSTITGVIDYTPLDKQLALLRFFKPQLKTLMIVYSASEPKFEREKDALKALTAQQGITLIEVPLYQPHTMYMVVEAQIRKNRPDALMVFKDSVVVSGIDSLIKLCSKHATTLMASDLDSVEKGAALGFGVHEYDMGVQGALLAQKILEEGLSARALPIHRVGDCKIKLNLDTMSSQGIAVSEEVIALLKDGEVYSKKGEKS